MLSYRRSDAAGITGRIVDRLTAHFGREFVFVDIDAIPLGVDFHQYIDDAIKRTDFLLAVIGPGWRGPRPDGTDRLADPADPVRIEIETALRNGVRIVPILVEGAKMPDRDALPDALKALHNLNAARVNAGIDFEAHITRVIQSLDNNCTSSNIQSGYRGNLPRRLAPLVGRASEVSEVAAFIRGEPLITLIGAGGVGKTCLALTVAESIRDEFPDGIWLVDLAPLRDRALVANEVALTLGIRQSSQRAILDEVIDAVESRCLLLLIDNCEHLITEAALVAEKLIRACPRLHVLATSREPLGAERERTYRIPHLAIPVPGTRVSLLSALEFPSVTLFVERATAANAKFKLTDDNVSTVCEICSELDGNALAIELAAARSDGFSVKEIGNLLDERFQILSGGRRTALPRQHTLRATIDWSYDLLAGSEQTLFRRLAIFPSGCSMAAALSVCAFDELTTTSVLRDMPSLVRKSLIVADFEEPGTRYRLLESTHAYAAEKAAPDWATLSAKLADWVINFAEGMLATGDQGRGKAWLARSKLAIENIRAALQWSISSPLRIPKGAALLDALTRSMFWYEAGLEVEGRRWIDAFLTRTDEAADPLVAGRLWRSLSSSEIGRRSVEAGERAVELLGRCGSPQDLARAHSAFAFALFQVGRFEEASDAVSSSLDFFKSEGLEESLEFANALETRAIAFRAQGRIDDALDAFGAALTIFEGMNNERGAASVRGNLAELEFSRGNPREALRLIVDVAAAFHRIGATSREATALVNAATYNVVVEQFDQARESAVKALNLAEGAKDAVIVAVALLNIAAVKAFGAQPQVAARLAGYVGEWYRRSGFELDSSEQRLTEMLNSHLSSVFDSGELEALRSAGAELSQDEAVEEALAE